MAEEQVCRPIDGFMFCNFVVRNGIQIRSKSGKNLKFPIKWRAKKEGVIEEAKGKTATPHVEK
jgi:hypothetical protein